MIASHAIIPRECEVPHSVSDDLRGPSLSLRMTT